MRERDLPKTGTDLGDGKIPHLNPEETAIIDQAGQVLSTEVRITGRDEHQNIGRVFLRFRYQGQIWVGYTLKDTGGALRCKISSFAEMDQPSDQPSKTKPCRGCGQDFVGTRGQSYCPECRDSRKLAQEQKRSRTCSKCDGKLGRDNKTGLCDTCYRATPEAAENRSLWLHRLFNKHAAKNKKPRYPYKP